jgi:hypothetical protein
MIISNSILCEIRIDGTVATGARIPFSENQKISSNDFEKKYLVYGLFVYNQTQLAVSPSNRTVLASNAGLAITLMTGNTEKVFYSPLNQYSTFLNGGIFYDIEPFVINYPACYLTVLDTTTTITGQSVCFSLLFKNRK